TRWDPREPEPTQLEGQSLLAWRKQIVRDVQLLREELQDEQGIQDLSDEFQFGFKVLGPLPTGTNWDVRQVASPARQKVRRADDWRQKRSGHNSTVFVLDARPYAGTQTVLTSVQAAAEYGAPVLAALDHDGAYRALPVRSPDECFVLVPSDEGPQVFQHLVLPFGGTGSVWAYLRVADVICFNTLVLAYIPAAHFVDDFYFSEPPKTAESAFDCFCMLQSLLGFTMKESKAQKPCDKSTLLGVLWAILEKTVTAGPSQGRLEKLQALLQKTLSEGSLSPEEAAHLAGKLNFVCSWVFGGAGKALLKCIYTCQHSPFPQKKLNAALEVVVSQQPGQKWAYRTMIPKHLLARAASSKASKAFIFWLAAIAQIVSIAAASNVLSGWFWCWAASVRLNLVFVGVSSKANLSDQVSRGDWEIMSVSEWSFRARVEVLRTDQFAFSRLEQEVGPSEQLKGLELIAPSLSLRCLSGDGGGAHVEENFRQGPNTSAIFRSCRAGRDGGLDAWINYQQEAGSSVLFENCSADRALAVENVGDGGGAAFLENFTQGPNSSAIFRSCRAGQDGGGLYAKGGYQQDAGSSVLFEHCSAKRTSAVENVDELTWQIRTRCAKMHE
ncbi:unnamed protein product, partial [Symbiodinium necroappetens]